MPAFHSLFYGELVRLGPGQMGKKDDDMGSYPISLRRQGNYYLAGSKSAYSPRFLNFDYPFASFEPAAFRDCEANRGFMIRAGSERKTRPRRANRALFSMAEEQGFEPWLPVKRLRAFQARPFDHLGIPPVALKGKADYRRMGENAQTKFARPCYNRFPNERNHR